MTALSPRRQAFLAWLEAQLGKPYLWGGRGMRCTAPWGPWGTHRKPYDADGMFPSPYEGWDCGGFWEDGVFQAGGPDFRLWDTDRAWKRLEPVATPTPGDLAFYTGTSPSGPNDVQHVEVVVGMAEPVRLLAPAFPINGYPIRGWRTIGASGGNRTTTTLEAAKAQGARVRYRAHHLLRPGFCGFRRLPGMDPADEAQTDGGTCSRLPTDCGEP